MRETGTPLELPGNLDLSALDEWVKRFPAEQVRYVIDKVRAHRDFVNEFLDDLEDRLALYERLAHPVTAMLPPVESNGTGDATSARITKRTINTISRKRQAILELLGSEPRKKVPFPAISNHLIGLNLMQNTERDKKSLGMMLGGMVDRGEIHRPVRGHYKFGPDPRANRNEAPAIAGVQSS